MSGKFSLTLMAAAASLGTLVTAAHAQSVSSAHVDVLAKSTKSWNGKRYTAYPKGQPELTMLKMTIPANTALPWHKHPYPNAGYVLQGQLTIEDRASGKKETFHTGQAFTESVDDVHRGVSGPTPTILIITYSGTPGVPTFKAEPGQKPEY
ncbi:cupin domain-containing protein [Novosphingobium sp. 9]|uniref:cupin domain-containing protein n=1 Tax=Novosphingobium sp. 9 TaxID=2025349 RepID=UPI0021B5E24D|nr:cupin domain-containing protein [Novosphingobium sp. 9]